MQDLRVEKKLAFQDNQTKFEISFVCSTVGEKQILVKGETTSSDIMQKSPRNVMGWTCST